MMHSRTIKRGNMAYDFTYNGDYSGDVLIMVREIVAEGTQVYKGNVKVPSEVLFNFVADALRDKRIASLEQADWKELLKW